MKVSTPPETINHLIFQTGFNVQLPNRCRWQRGLKALIVNDFTVNVKLHGGLVLWASQLRFQFTYLSRWSNKIKYSPSSINFKKLKYIFLWWGGEIYFGERCRWRCLPVVGLSFLQTTHLESNSKKNEEKLAEKERRCGSFEFWKVFS